MKRLWVFRVWHVPVSVLLAAVVSVVINLATEEFSWALTSGLVTLVLAQAGLAMRQAVEDQRDRRDARDRLLKPLRLPPHALPKFDDLPAGRRAEDSVFGAAAVALWLTASASPTPLWGRRAVRDRLVTWCAERDPQVGVVRVVTGPAGVGKSRLARAVAESLPAGWAAGRLNGGVDVLVDRIAAAGEPTLVVVDDADRVPDLDVLISRAVHHPTLVRLLVLTRTTASLRLLPDTVLAELTRVEALGPIGEAADRQRWYTEAARAYARELRRPAPDLPDRPVGTDEDTPLVLHARALLAVLGRSGIRTWSLRDLVTELVTLEQSTWQADLPRLPAGCDIEVLTEVVAVLLLLPAASVNEAAELLRRVPQFSHDTAQESRVAVARWAHRRYPPGPDHRLDLRPHLVGERLLLDALTRTPTLLHDRDAPAAAPVLARAHSSFPDALDHLTALLTRQPHQLPDVLAAVLATGVTGHALDHALAALVDTHGTDSDLRPHLITLDHTIELPYLFMAQVRLSVEHFRELTETEPDRYRPDLARSLLNYGALLGQMGRTREALDAAEQAVGHFRELTETEPDRYHPNLAASLDNLGMRLGEVGRRREALDAAEEAVAIRHELTQADPDHYRPDLARSLDNLGLRLYEVGRRREALDAIEKAVAIRHKLIKDAPDRHRPNLAGSLLNLGIRLGEMGRAREALEALEQAVGHFRELIETEPDRYRPDLARSLSHLGIRLAEVGWAREALEALEQAVGHFRELIETEPDRYCPDLAQSLDDLGVLLSRVGDRVGALRAQREAVALWRECAERDPELYEASYQRAAAQLRRHLNLTGHHDQAVAHDLNAERADASGTTTQDNSSQPSTPDQRDNPDR